MNYEKKLDAINRDVIFGLDKEGLLKARKKLYRMKNDCLSINEWLFKQTLIKCINELTKENNHV